MLCHGLNLACTEFRRLDDIMCSYQQMQYTLAVAMPVRALVEGEASYGTLQK